MAGLREYWCFLGSLTVTHKITLQVAHFVEYTGHATPHWNLLSLEEAADVKHRERSESDPADSDLAWSCNHCATYFDAWAKRQPVVQHVKST